eukprot:gnl/Chilomastix_cuspidata/1125.p1 GENE.gnl/Chilomastix_cuspidata/1125~~gnl/Chilomastix_cuspidata/1125.p1  ORF type:complete len:268 (-),score=112.64 gnl/Chilomastix_cuspidata/1125:36-806(-)
MRSLFALFLALAALAFAAPGAKKRRPDFDLFTELSGDDFRISFPDEEGAIVLEGHVDAANKTTGIVRGHLWEVRPDNVTVPRGFWRAEVTEKTTAAVFFAAPAADAAQAEWRPFATFAFAKTAHNVLQAEARCPAGSFLRVLPRGRGAFEVLLVEAAGGRMRSVKVEKVRAAEAPSQGLKKFLPMLPLLLMPLMKRFMPKAPAAPAEPEATPESAPAPADSLVDARPPTTTKHSERSVMVSDGSPETDSFCEESDI